MGKFDIGDTLASLGLHSSVLPSLRDVDSIARIGGVGRALADATRLAGNASSVSALVGRDFGPASHIARLLEDQKVSATGGWANIAASLATDHARHGSLLEAALTGAKWHQPLEAAVAASLTRQHGALAAAGIGHLTSLVAEVTRPTRVVSAFLADTLMRAESAEPDLRGKLFCSISQAESDLDLYSDVVATVGEVEIVDSEDPPEVIITSPSVFRDELVRDEASGMAVARAMTLAREIVEMRRSLNEVTHIKQKRRLFDTTTHTEAAVGGLFWLVPLAPKEPHYGRGKFDFEEGKPPRDRYNSRDGWWPARSTLVFIGGVAFGLAIFEVAERVEATRDAKGGYVRVRGLGARPKDTSRSTWDLRHLPNGRLVVFAHSPYRHVNRTRYWHEQARGQLRALVPDIVSVLEQMAPDIAARAHAADAKAKEDARVRDQEELEKARVATEKRRSEAAAASRKDFLQLVEQWALAERVGAFCSQLAERVHKLEPPERDHVEQRLAAAAALSAKRVASARCFATVGSLSARSLAAFSSVRRASVAKCSAYSRSTSYGGRPFAARSASVRRRRPSCWRSASISFSCCCAGLSGFSFGGAGSQTTNRGDGAFPVGCDSIHVSRSERRASQRRLS